MPVVRGSRHRNSPALGASGWRPPRRACRRHLSVGHQDRRTVGALQLGHHTPTGARRTGPHKPPPSTTLAGPEPPRQQRRPAGHADDRRARRGATGFTHKYGFKRQRAHPTAIRRITTMPSNDPHVQNLRSASVRQMNNGCPGMNYFAADRTLSSAIELTSLVTKSRRS